MKIYFKSIKYPDRILGIYFWKSATGGENQINKQTGLLWRIKQWPSKICPPGTVKVNLVKESIFANTIKLKVSRLDHLVFGCPQNSRTSVFTKKGKRLREGHVKMKVDTHTEEREKAGKFRSRNN